MLQLKFLPTEKYLFKSDSGQHSKWFNLFIGLEHYGQQGEHYREQGAKNRTRAIVGIVQNAEAGLNLSSIVEIAPQSGRIYSPIEEVPRENNHKISLVQ